MTFGIPDFDGKHVGIAGHSVDTSNLNAKDVPGKFSAANIANGLDPTSNRQRLPMIVQLLQAPLPESHDHGWSELEGVTWHRD